MQEFVKFECPLLLLVVNDTPLLVFGNRDGHSLWKRTLRWEWRAYLSVLIDIDVFGREVRRGARTDHDLDGFFLYHSK